MGQLDEVSQSIGKLQATVEQHGYVHARILDRLDSMEARLISKIQEHDDKIDRLEAEENKRKGVILALASLAGIAVSIVAKIIERLF